MIRDYIEAARRAVQGSADKNADYVRGSDYEALAGANAMLWARQTQRDADLFKAIRFHDADGDDLTRLVRARYGIERVLDTRGTGTAVLSRPAAGTAGTVWKGTRIVVNGASAKYYRTTADTAVAATDTTVRLAIECEDVGPSSLVAASSQIQLDDPLWDSTWTVSSIVCGAGTLFESAAALRDRVRTTRSDARPGQKKGIEDTCIAAGAANVVLFRSDYGGEALDAGLNVCYVGDLGYSGSSDLVKACKVALWSARVLGDHMQVLPMARTTVDITVTVTLRESPATFDTTRLDRIHRESIRQYLNGSSGTFTYTLSGLASAIARNTPEVQGISFTTPSADATILASGNFPATLNRYVVGDIAITYA